MVAVKQSVIKPSKFVLFELTKAIEGGNDSEAKAILAKMECEEIDYLLQLVRRLKSMVVIAHRRKRSIIPKSSA